MYIYIYIYIYVFYIYIRQLFKEYQNISRRDVGTKLKGRCKTLYKVPTL